MVSTRVLSGGDACELVLGSGDVFDDAQRVGVQGLVGGPLAGFADVGVVEVLFDLLAGLAPVLEVGVEVGFFAEVVQRVQFAELAGGAGDGIEDLRVGLQEALVVDLGAVIGDEGK